MDLATLGVANLYLAGARPSGDWLIVHMRPEYTSIAILRGSDLIFFRNQAEGDTEPLTDVVHQTVMYYQDRLSGKGFSRVFAGGRSRLAGGVEAAVRDIESRLGTVVEALDPTTMVPLVDRISVTPRQGAALAPLVGMLLRSRRRGGGRVIRTNLSTRPFYNARAVHALLACLPSSSLRRRFTTSCSWFG